MAAIPVSFFFAQTLLVPGSLTFLITNSKRYHSCICRGLEHVVGHNLTMQIEVEILYYPKMWLLYCTNKIIIFFPPYDYSAHESALIMQFRAQKCPQDVIPRAKVPFSLKQHRALFQSWAEHCTVMCIVRCVIYAKSIWIFCRWASQNYDIEPCSQ